MTKIQPDSPGLLHVNGIPRGEDHRFPRTGNETFVIQSAQYEWEVKSNVDAVMRGMQVAPEEAAIMRFNSVSMRMGVAGIWNLPSGLGQAGWGRRKTGEGAMANVIEFYIPATFRKPAKRPVKGAGKVIEFCPPAKKSA